MQIVAISDTHRFHRELEIPECDLLIHAGDLTNVGEADVLADFLAWTQQIPAKQVVFVAGNHDFGFGPHIQTPDNVHYLQDAAITLFGYRIYGSPWVPRINGSHAFEAQHAPVADPFAAIPDDVELLVTHAPPYGILDKEPYVPRFGSRPLAQRLPALKQLKVHVFGHVHQAHGRHTHDGVRHHNVACLNHEHGYLRPPQHIWLRDKR